MPGVYLEVAWLVLAAAALPATAKSRSPTAGGERKLAQCLRRGLQREILTPEPGPRDGFMLGSASDGRLYWWRGREWLAAQALAPGSVFKLVVAYTLLERRPDLMDMVYDCRGRGQFGPDHAERRCWLRGGHGRVNLARALSQSCNLYFAKLGILLGAESILATARLFGLGRSTGSDLGGEVPGSLPRRVTAGSLPELATGQHPGLRVTATQLFAMTAALANGGRLVAPLIDATQQVTPGLLENGPALDFLARALRLASLHGTGSEQGLARYHLAGKTGTAGWPATPWITYAWYAGWAPWEKPEVVLVVFVARGTGSHQAAALAARVMEHYSRVRSRCLAGREQ